MLSSVQQTEFASLFPFIQQASPEFQQMFYRQVKYAELAEGVSICEEGQQCAQLAMVLDGVGRVYKLSPGGREITLYRIYSGQSCVLTASCIMNQDSFPAMAIAESPLRAVLVEPSRVREWFCREPLWQQFIFRLLSNRLADIISVVEEVAFKRIDVRLAEQFSRSLEQGHNVIRKTHAELAADVGSSREVISRILRDFSQRGLIQSTRGSIEVIDEKAIIQLSRE